jgi:hypothetical protein
MDDETKREAHKLQPAYNAVYARIASLGDGLPTEPVQRNAMIWHCVNDALKALREPEHDPDLWDTVTDLDSARQWIRELSAARHDLVAEKDAMQAERDALRVEAAAVDFAVASGYELGFAAGERAGYERARRDIVHAIRREQEQYIGAEVDGLSIAARVAGDCAVDPHVQEAPRPHPASVMRQRVRELAGANGEQLLAELSAWAYACGATKLAGGDADGERLARWMGSVLNPDHDKDTD